VYLATPRTTADQLSGADLSHRRRDIERLRAFRARGSKLEDSHFPVVAHDVIKMAGLDVDLAAHGEFGTGGGIGSSHIFGLRFVDRLMGAGGESAFLFWNRPVVT
jgi:hypothetical protein